MAVSPPKEVISDTASNAAAEVTVGAGTAAGDTLVVVAVWDWFTIGDAPDPTSDYTGLDWSEPVAELDLGTNDSKCRVWVQRVPTGQGGAKTISVGPIFDTDVLLAVLVYSGVDADEPVDGAAASSAPAIPEFPSPFEMPVIAPTTEGARWIGIGWTKTFDGGGDFEWTGSEDLTELLDQVMSGGAVSVTIADEELGASGPVTGRVAEYQVLNKAGGGIAIALREQGAEAPANEITASFTAVAGELAVEVETPIEATATFGGGGGVLTASGSTGGISADASFVGGAGQLAASVELAIEVTAGFTAGAGQLAVAVAVQAPVDLTVEVGPSRVGSVAVGASRTSLLVGDNRVGSAAVGNNRIGSVTVRESRTNRGE